MENEEHCDFGKLREALLRVNVEDLRARTDAVLYENYRRNRLRQMGIKEGDLGLGMQQAVEEVRDSTLVLGHPKYSSRDLLSTSRQSNTSIGDVNMRLYN